MASKLTTGDLVIMVKCSEAETYKDKIWEVRSEPWKLGCGEEVVLLEGKSGGFSTKCLKKLPAINRKTNPIYSINSTQADQIIETRKPLGMFIHATGIFVGIDNRTGAAWTEDFKGKTRCVSWLLDK